MPSTSALFAAIDYLAAAAKNAYASYSTPDGTPVQVLDGPPSVQSQSTVTARVYVGFDPDNPDSPIALADQDFAALGTYARNERGEIVCAVQFWNGDNENVKAVRDGVGGLLAAFELLLRGSGSNPGDATMAKAVTYSQISGGIAYSQLAASDGLVGQAVFHVGFMARLTSSSS